MFKAKFFNMLSGYFFIPALLAFFLVGYHIFPESVSLISRSGDAHSIWRTIVSYRSEDVADSYVLYKGFLSVYPYVWLYDLSNSFGFNEFFFIKLYHCALYSFISAIAIPNIVSNLLNVRVSMTRNVIFVTILFYMVKFTGIFDSLMIDLPSWAIFVAVIVLFFHVTSESVLDRNLLLIAFFGVFIGLSASASGQYSLAAFIILAGFCYQLIKEIKSKQERIVRGIIVATLFLGGVAAPKIYDMKFESEIVMPMRQSGKWLPTGQQWFSAGLTRLMPYYKYGYPNISNRGVAVLKLTEGNEFESKFELIKSGAYVYSSSKYLQMVRDNIFDFIVMWSTKIFISISYDDGSTRVRDLFVSYSALYISLLTMVLNVRNISSFISRKSLVPLSFISTMAAPVILFIDMRYSVALFGFILGIATFQDVVWQNVIAGLRQLKSIQFYSNLFDKRVPYSLIFYCFFVSYCFVLYGSLLEIPGSNPSSVLFRW